MIIGSPGSSPPDEALTRAADELLRRHGRVMSGPLERIASGGNNRIFRAACVDGSPCVVKAYFRAPDDRRDRFESERRFYRFASAAAARWTPRALGWDPAAAIGLLEQIEGRRPNAGEIGEPEVTAALAFFRALNAALSSPEAAELPLAAEACFSLGQHLRSVDGRLERLQAGPAEGPLETEARRFVAAELVPAWRRVRAAAAREDQGRELAATGRCVSPSDFGFHNCLRRSDGSLVFFDFEYSGWDDPAKMVCDFFCQPEIPAPRDCFERFARETAGALGGVEPGPFVARCRALLPVYRLKWCGIMLNEFVPSGRERRSFALGPDALAARQKRQLASAQSALAALAEAI